MIRVKGQQKRIQDWPMGAGEVEEFFSFFFLNRKKKEKVRFFAYNGVCF